MTRRPLLRSLLPSLLVFVALLPFAAAAATPQPALVEGTDYEVIEGGTPFAPVKGKVEVVEVFGYTCPHCAHFQPTVSAWAKKNAKVVNFIPMAAPFGGSWQPYAQAYYAAQVLGVAENCHQHALTAPDGSLPLRNATPGEIAPFYARYGVDQAKFLATYDGADVAARIAKAEQFIKRSGVEGTPTLVINGRYRVIGHDFTDVLRIADQLVARERDGKTR